MKRILMTVLLCAACLAGGREAAAQMTQADSAAVLLGVANRLRVEGRTALANSLVDLILERFAGTPAAAEAQQLRVALRRTPEEQDGKTELLVFSTVYGIIMGGLIPAAMDVESEEGYGLGLIAGGPLGFLLGRGILNSRPVSEGQARAISFSTFWGMWQGLGWKLVFEIGDEEFCDPFTNFCSSDTSDRAVFTSLMLGSAAGLGTGLVLSRKPIAAGTATTVNLAGLWGAGYGTALALLADLDGDDEWLTATLVGGNLGIVTAALMAPSWNLSRGRARLISIAGVAGLLAGGGVLLIAQPDDEKVAIAVPTATSLLGLALGVHWTRNYDVRNGSRAPGPGGDALLDLRGGQWSLNMPEPGLRMIETRAHNRPVYRPGVAVPLLKAAF
ncbi:MAG: hypothetical protein ACRERX_22575 [Pseudomonas sp.]